MAFVIRRTNDDGNYSYFWKSARPSRRRPFGWFKDKAKFFNRRCDATNSARFNRLTHEYEIVEIELP